MRRRRFLGIAAGTLGLGTCGGVLAWDRWTLKRVAIVEPGRILRGAWPNPTPLLGLIRRESIRTVVTLTAINVDDPKYVEQNRVIGQTSANWTILPMRGSTATVEQMAEAADLIARPENQPVFFHCVGGHHRSNLVHAAYLIRHKHTTAAEAWSIVSRLLGRGRIAMRRTVVGSTSSRLISGEFMTWRNRLRWSIRVGLLAIALPGSFVAYRWGSGNYGTVEPGRIYRAAQPSAKSLAKAIRRDGIKTVLNLRGANPDQSWYAAEKAATLVARATQVDFPMSSDQWLSREQVRTLLEILDTCERPVLIHCEWGAERTGLVAAICVLLKDGSTLADGRREFSAYYLFLPVKDGLVMRGHLDRYEHWLADRGETHTSGAFRRWLTQSYEPGTPSREHWPCNPYPLKVVTTPRTEAVALWGTTRCR